MDTISLKGKITKVFPAEKGVSKAGNEWRKQGFLLTMDEGSNYAKDVYITIMGDKIEQLTRAGRGSNVEVNVNISSRGFERKDGMGLSYFTEVSAWKITRTDAPVEEARYETKPDDDDLPF